jgi:hypothetical protein
LSQRDLPCRDLAKLVRDPRELDDLDRREGWRLFEFILNRRESGTRDRDRAFDADVDVGSLAGRAGRPRPDRNTR